MSYFLSIFISFACLRNEEAITCAWSRISSWQVFHFLLYRQSSILQDILFYIWYLTICFWIDWVHVIVYKYTEIKGLDSSTREITSLPESTKSDERGMSFQSLLKMKCSMKVYNTQPVSHSICPIDRSFAYCPRFFFFSTTCSKVISTFKQ